MANTKKSSKVAPVLVAEICLYGNAATCGAGWLATRATGGMLGTGEPKKDLSFTEAVWSAVEALREAGIVDGVVAIYAPDGERYALAPIRSVPYFGSLQWKSPTPGYVISADEIKAAAL